jgi:xanthine dehydrogenase YagT iron-sulfur-binding subunit
MGDHGTRQAAGKSAAAPTTEPAGVSRRKFLQAMGLGATAATLPDEGLLGRSLPAAEPQAPADAALGPGPVPVTLKVNGQTYKLAIEPRVTLLDALRNHFHDGTAGHTPEPIDLTGQKRVCDRASCGACTMIVDGRTVYGCTVLAIEAEGKEIRTVEGLEKDGKLHPVQEEFVHHDGLMCGFCTPGFVMSAVALLEKNPSPTRADIRRAFDGNICRCGTQCRALEAVEAAAPRLRK